MSQVEGVGDCGSAGERGWGEARSRAGRRGWVGKKVHFDAGGGGFGDFYGSTAGEADRAPAGVERVVGSQCAETSRWNVGARLIDDGNGESALLRGDRLDEDEKGKDLRLVETPAFPGKLDPQDVLYSGLETHLEYLTRWRKLRVLVAVVVRWDLQGERKALAGRHK